VKEITETVTNPLKEIDLQVFPHSTQTSFKFRETEISSEIIIEIATTLEGDRSTRFLIELGKTS
jgi:hypothetical protein